MNNKNKSITTANKHFEEIKNVDENGVECWTARELSKVLEYSEYRFFLPVIKKAKESCEKSGQKTEDHFEDVLVMVEIGSGAKRRLDDIKLSRYACYLVVQNADPAKKVVALGQTYFAVQTRKQELYESLSDDQKRILIRGEVSDQNKKLFKTAQDSGVSNFGRFNDAGYLGLYGLTAKQIKKKKGIKKDNILDRAGATELAANLFRITQTNEKLKKKLDDRSAVGQNTADQTHFMVGGKVRQTIKDIGGTVPEELPPEEHIKKLKKRTKLLKSNQDQKKKITQKANKSKK